MIVTTTKDYSRITLSEIKQGLKIGTGDDCDNDELLSLLQVAVNQAETFTNRNLVRTISNLTDYCVYGIWYCIDEPNAVISAITATNEAGDVTTTITDYKIYKRESETLIKFKDGLNAHTLNIVYTSGYEEIPEAIKRACIVKIRELYDMGDQYLSNTMVNVSAFERLLNPYRIIQ